jgi:hypothetical protein
MGQGSVQLLLIEFVSAFCLSSAKAGAMSSRTGSGSGSGERSFIGEFVSAGRGILAGRVRSSSPSLASSYSGLVWRDLEGLIEGLKSNRCAVPYGSCLNHDPAPLLPPRACLRKPGGDQGAPLLDLSSISISESSGSDLKPECCEGRSKSGERACCSSKSSREADSKGWSSKVLSSSSISAAAIVISIHQLLRMR